MADLMRQSVLDADFKRSLFEDTLTAAEIHGLDDRERSQLQSTSCSDLEAALGRLVLHKLLPVQIGRRVWISPAAMNGDPPDKRLMINLDQSETGAKIGGRGISTDPGRVFGSGIHPTTRLCVLLLETFIRPGMRVLDLGAGSGILALAAAKLGANHVIGLDVDPCAVRAAEANVLRNGLSECIEVHAGDARWLRKNKAAPFDLIVANILAGIHLQSFKQGLLEYLVPGGRLILSGMHPSGAVRVAQALYEVGADRVEYNRMTSWFALSAVIGQGS